MSCLEECCTARTCRCGEVYAYDGSDECLSCENRRLEMDEDVSA